MNADEIASATEAFLVGGYPDISVQVLDPDSSNPRRRVFFGSATFTDLYPLQRCHYIRHHLPAEFFREHFANAVWYELAPGESEQDLEYPDEDLGFFRRLDDQMCPEDAAVPLTPCYGDFRFAKAALAASGFGSDEHFEVLHVLMAEGGYCDCEILYNAGPDNRLKARYWSNRGRHQ